MNTLYSDQTFCTTVLILHTKFISKQVCTYMSKLYTLSDDTCIY